MRYIRTVALFVSCSALVSVFAQPPQPPEEQPLEKLPATREAMVQWIKSQTRVGDLSCTLSLGDGTLLRGELQPWEGGPKLPLKIRFSQQPLQVPLDDVVALRLRDLSRLPLLPPARVNFRDGSWVLGATGLILDGKSLRFSLPYAEGLEVPRGAVSDIEFVPGQQVAQVPGPARAMEWVPQTQRLLEAPAFALRDLQPQAPVTIPVKPGCVWLKNGDVISGQPLSISTDAMILKMDLGPEIKVPLAEVTRASLRIETETWVLQRDRADALHGRATLITGEMWNGVVLKLDTKGLQLGWYGGKSVALPLGLLHSLTEFEAGAQGLRQWAVAATASSEYGNPSWSAAQATGPPNAMVCGDSSSAWASREQDAGPEWIELKYATSVHATRVRVRETYNPGAVVRVEGVSPGGEVLVLWEGKDSTAQCPGWLDLRFAATQILLQTLRVHLDTRMVPGWNELDAVELLGTQ